MKNTTNVEIIQNSVALSLNPRFDQTKWLGRNAKIRVRVAIKFSLLFFNSFLVMEFVVLKIKKISIISAANP